MSRDGEDITPHGDTIFHVRDEGDSYWYRVSSHLLSAASKVFANMVDGRFAEGQDLNAGNPKEVPLRHDDSEAMGQLFCIIHHQTSKVYMPLTSNAGQLVVRVLKHADKYDCVDSVRFAMASWILDIVTAPPESDTEKFRCDDIIAAIDICYYLVAQLHQNARNAKKSLAYQLEAKLAKLGKASCAASGKHFQSVMRIFQDAKLWPVHELPNGRIYMERLKNLDDLKLSADRSSFSGCATNENCPFKNQAACVSARTFGKESLARCWSTTRGSVWIVSRLEKSFS